MSYLGYASFAAAGALVGVLYFLLLYRTVQLHAAGAEAARVVPLYMVRALSAVAAFWIIAREGAIPLLLALAGFLVVRYAAQYAMGRE